MLRWRAASKAMFAVVYHGPGQKSWKEVPKPTVIDDTDAIVRVDSTTICGTDLHILKGDVPAVTDGWILGHKIDGTQAEFVRVPFADTSTHAVPEGVADEQILMLADILPTGYEVGVLNGCVSPGDVVAVVGAGPIGLAAKAFGADTTINNGRTDAVAAIGELTDGLGADVAIEAVGVPATFELAAAMARPGGHIANIGVHGEPAALHREELWIRNLTITTGLVDTYSTPTLLKLTQGNQIDVDRFITHRFNLDQFEEAYDVFTRAGETGALKVVLSRT